MERLSEATRNSLFELLAFVISLTNSMSQKLQTDNKSTGDYNLMLKPISRLTLWLHTTRGGVWWEYLVHKYLLQPIMLLCFILNPLPGDMTCNLTHLYRRIIRFSYPFQSFLSQGTCTTLIYWWNTPYFLIQVNHTFGFNVSRVKENDLKLFKV